MAAPHACMYVGNWEIYNFGLIFPADTIHSQNGDSHLAIDLLVLIMADADFDP